MFFFKQDLNFIYGSCKKKLIDKIVLIIRLSCIKYTERDLKLS